MSQPISWNHRHFHKTTYYPKENSNEFLDAHAPDHFPVNIQIGDAPEIIRKAEFSITKPILLDLMRYPWTHGRSRSQSDSSGGAKRERQPARPILNHAFNALWDGYKFKNMTAIGLRKRGDATISWTVSFVRKGRRPPNRLQEAYTFETIDDSEGQLQSKLAELIPRRE